ncbi:hypothetical protein AK812_SmicGene320 [Symbiodinium microadriaticum]|uniref:Uncharacterized protein n=1 Tax=Symbiodinium microadriaticum TaxID=2951 RepID=A0A1Q9F6W6_SYMMI|nr:hypothetical protein AK812_SmicGene320 [Symbiodinium microadriaticum]
MVPAESAGKAYLTHKAANATKEAEGLDCWVRRMPASKHGLVLWLAPLMLSFHSANTALGSLLTFYVPESELGTVIGLSVATMPLSSILAVQAAGHIFKRHGFAAVPLSSAGFLLAASALIFAFGWLPPPEASEAEVESIITIIIIIIISLLLLHLLVLHLILILILNLILVITIMMMIIMIPLLTLLVIITRGVSFIDVADHGHGHDHDDSRGHGHDDVDHPHTLQQQEVGCPCEPLTKFVSHYEHFSEPVNRLLNFVESPKPEFGDRRDVAPMH